MQHIDTERGIAASRQQSGNAATRQPRPVMLPRPEENRCRVEDAGEIEIPLEQLVHFIRRRQQNRTEAMQQQAAHAKRINQQTPAPRRRPFSQIIAKQGIEQETGRNRRMNLPVVVNAADIAQKRQEGKRNKSVADEVGKNARLFFCRNQAKQRQGEIYRKERHKEPIDINIAVGENAFDDA